MHQDAQECYFLLQGELLILVAETLVSLKPKEILVVKPKIPHAIVGGEGRIEHIGTHPELLASSPTYRNLHDKQQVHADT